MLKHVKIGPATETAPLLSLLVAAVSISHPELETHPTAAMLLLSPVVAAVGIRCTNLERHPTVAVPLLSPLVAAVGQGQKSGLFLHSSELRKYALQNLWL